MTNECISYERRIETMAKDKKQNKENNIIVTSEQFDDLKNEINKIQYQFNDLKNDVSKVHHQFDDLKNDVNKIQHQLETSNTWKKSIASAVFSIAASLIIGGLVFYGDMRVVKEYVSDLKDKNVESRITALETTIKFLNESATIPTEAITVAFNGDALPFISSEKNADNEMVAPAWTNTDIIATNVNTGIQYTAENLANKPILTSYILDGQEVFFYGEFNENNNWNNNCIINVYKNNELVLVMDAVYDNGELLSYEQVLKASTEDGDIWVVSKRTHNDGINTGETWNYVREYAHPKIFESENVKEENIIGAEDFQTNVNSRLLSYYNGNTSDGTYNDKSGNAYLIKYNEDGTVKLLYVGNFINGNCNDKTGNAFSIAYSEETDAYYHNTGNFTNGHAEHLSTHPLTKTEIDNIIKDISFNCELIWKE